MKPANRLMECFYYAKSRGKMQPAFAFATGMWYHESIEFQEASYVSFP